MDAWLWAPPVTFGTKYALPLCTMQPAFHSEPAAPANAMLAAAAEDLHRLASVTMPLLAPHHVLCLTTPAAESKKATRHDATGC